jgi:lysozyme
MPSLSISSEGLDLIKEYEGFRAEPTQLPDGNWVVGHGHVRIGEAGPALTRAEAEELLALDLAPVERSVGGKVSAVLTQNQFDALVSFAFSVGVDAFEQSAVLRRVNSGAFVAAGCAMDAWRKSDLGGELVVIDALVRRRAAEKALLLRGGATDTTPSAYMRAKLDYAASVLGAPADYAQAPEVGSIPVQAPKPAPALRLTEILKSEPATEALLLTRVATDEELAAHDEIEEIVTAHAKPVARKLEQPQARKPSPRKSRFRFLTERPTESVGLLALLAFGLGLILLGGSTLFGGSGDFVDILGASALMAPGLAATFMAGFGLWRGPTPRLA